MKLNILFQSSRNQYLIHTQWVLHKAYTLVYLLTKQCADVTTQQARIRLPAQKLSPIYMAASHGCDPGNAADPPIILGLTKLRFLCLFPHDLLTTANSSIISGVGGIILLLLAKWRTDLISSFPAQNSPLASNKFICRTKISIRNLSTLICQNETSSRNNTAQVLPDGNGLVAAPSQFILLRPDGKAKNNSDGENQNSSSVRLGSGKFRFESSFLPQELSGSLPA